MRKTITQFIAFLFLTIAVLGIFAVFKGEVALAEGALNIPQSTYYGDIPKPPSNKNTVELIKEGFFGEDGSLGAFQIFRYVMGAVAILMLIVGGLRLVIAQGEEEAITKSKSIITLSIIGLVLISMAGEVGGILSFDRGGPLGNPNQTLARVVDFDKKVRIVITFIKYVIGSVAVLMAIRSGIMMVTQGSDEEAMTKEKKRLGLSAAGLILIIFADTLIRKVFYKIDTTAYPGIEGVQPSLDPYRGVKEIVGITNFVVTFISPIAVLVFLAGGIMYLTARDDEEQTTKARRMMIAAGAGIIIIYGAFALVSTFISGKIGTPPV